MELRHYKTASGRDVFENWLESLNDRKAATRIAARLDRLAAGNFGDCKFVGSGVSELRIDYGPGYRIYLGRIGRDVVLLLCGGDKRRQAADIASAVQYLADFKRQNGLS